MDENAIHQWLIDCFGQVQGEMAWSQLSQLPDSIREQLMSQDPSKLPKPKDVQSLMQAFATGGLNDVNDMRHTMEEGPINTKLATSIALQEANSAGSEQSVGAEEGDVARRAMSEANLWLDTACEFDPAHGEPQALTRAGWVEGTLEAWVKFAAPVAQSMNDALAAVIGERLGGELDGEVAGMFAGPIPIPIPEGMKEPAQLMKLLGNTSFAMQLGHAAGDLSHEVRGSFDQGIALLKNSAGALIIQNALEYAKSLEIPQEEVLAFIALQEVAHARLYAAVPWLMPRFEALIGKYARGISIDLDAMEERLREAGAMNPEAISGAVNLTNVGIADTPEQQEALRGIETLLALVEGWVDCVTWHAGTPHIPHIEQLREMLRRERAVGGPAERTFESLLGMQLRPKRMREAAAIWERITAEDGNPARDAKWSHPDLLPTLPTDQVDGKSIEAGKSADAPNGAETGTNPPAVGAKPAKSIDWDAELTKLLEQDPKGDNSTNGDTGGTDNADGAQRNDDSSDHGSDGETHDAAHKDQRNPDNPTDK